MADLCSIKKSPKFQTLKQMSGASDFSVSVAVNSFIDNYGRYPELDELFEVNSFPYLMQALHMKNNGFTTPDMLLEYTGAESVEEANYALNNQFRDQFITVLDYGDEVEVKSEPRPKTNEYKTEESVDVEEEIDPVKSRHIIENGLYRLKRLYGINVHSVTTEEILNQFGNEIPEMALSKAFIYNGEIYLNIDNASADSEIHELTHVFLGGLKFVNPTKYQKLVSIVQQFPNLSKLAENFPGRTESDVMEEIFVTEFAKFVSEMPSAFDNIPEEIIYEMEYETLRNLDTVINGDISVKCVDNPFKETLISLSKLVDSSLANNQSLSITDFAEINRKLANRKQQLLRKGDLIQDC